MRTLAARRRKHEERLRQLRRSKDVASECYNGKLDLLKTYEQMGIENEEVLDLARRVRQKQVQLVYRGEPV